MTQHLTRQGHHVLHDREGCSLKAYKDTVGVWTIGYGHTSAAGPPKVTQGLTITEHEAKAIFRRDLATFEKAVRDAVKTEMQPHEYDAYVSLCYNIGGPGFASSTTVREYRAGNIAAAAEAILMWNKPPEIMDRRRGEYYQFLGTCAMARVPAGGPPQDAPPVVA